MKQINYFKCSSCSKVTDELVEGSVKSIPCKCGGDMIKQLSAPKCFSNSATCEGRSPSCK